MGVNEPSVEKAVKMAKTSHSAHLMASFVLRGSEKPFLRRRIWLARSPSTQRSIQTSIWVKTVCGQA